MGLYDNRGDLDSGGAGNPSFEPTIVGMMPTAKATALASEQLGLHRRMSLMELTLFLAEL